MNHYEAGLKSQWLQQRLTANIAGFWTEINDYQATVTNSQANVIRGYLANAEKVRVRGIELDLALRPIEQLSLYVNSAFTDQLSTRSSPMRYALRNWPAAPPRVPRIPRAPLERRAASVPLSVIFRAMAARAFPLRRSPMVPISDCLPGCSQ